MSSEGIAAVAARFIHSVFNRGELEAIDEVFDEAHVMHYPLLPDLPPGRAGVREYVERKRRAFPDFTIRIDDNMTFDRQVAVRATLGGTHCGRSMVGFEPTGRSAMTSGQYWFRFDGAWIVETWVSVDCLAAALQLGAVVPTGERVGLPDLR